ncbi:hypothetical protein THMIRHAS_03830 [Thiosulfatimonas sediminis]|uniref:Uncharacterized protein n=1 Tax=Thiosulfatimonas sediminis TaxID=2675054 RepID=A0A6F8PSP6_9GAMM|nr:hypothetical protein THMIRHAS_03830 [Thiosulfatimonas sediminis]
MIELNQKSSCERRREEADREFQLYEKLGACNTFSELVGAIGFDLDKYKNLELTPKDLAENLELRGWLLNRLHHEDAGYMIPFNDQSEQRKAEMIVCHFESPITFDSRSHWQSSTPVLKLNTSFSEISPTPNGKVFKVSSDSNDYSVPERLFLGINPYASKSLIIEQIELFIEKQREELRSKFPKFENRQNRSMDDQSKATSEVLSKKVLQALDLWILWAYADLFSFEVAYHQGYIRPSDQVFHNRLEILEILFEDFEELPSRPKNWEVFFQDCLNIEFIKWLRANE